MLAPPHQAAQTRACRDAILTVLQQVLCDHRPADRALALFFRAHRYLGARDRRLISETLFAVLRWWGWLQPLLPEPPRPALPATQHAAPLPLAVQQAWARFLLAAHLLEGRLPAIAAQWQATAAVSPGDIERVLATADAPARFAAYGSLLGVARDLAPPALSALLPAWAQGELQAPRPLEELIHWMQRRPPLWLRLRQEEQAAVLASLAGAGLSPRAHPQRATAVQIGLGPVNLQTVSAYREGRCEVQDLASQAVGWVSAPRPGERWWDVCAGAGGKTLALADLMGNAGQLVATDLRTASLRELERRAQRAGLTMPLQAQPWKGTLPLPAGVTAACAGVLLDAPCSGSGRWRRNPDARWSMRPETLPALVARQQALLQLAAQGVRPGGTLLYATCSLFARENEAVVSAFLRRAPQFALAPFPHPLDGTPTPGMLQLWPWDGDCDALFIARMQRHH